MSNFFQNIVGKGDKPITDVEEQIIYEMLLNGDRKSAVLSTMLEQGYEKNQLKDAIEEKAIQVKEYKHSPEGIKEMIDINKKRIKNGFIAIILGGVLTVVAYLVSGIFDAFYFYFFYGAILWGMYSLVRGIIGFIIYKSVRR